MKSTNKILKRVISLLMIFIIFINYSYPAIVYADHGTNNCCNSWTKEYNKKVGEDNANEDWDTFDSNTEKDSTSNRNKAEIARDGTIMQADAINRLLNNGDLILTYELIRKPGTIAGEWENVIQNFELKTKDGSKDTGEIIELIKNKIKEMNEGNHIVRSYATSSTLSENLDTWFKKIKEKRSNHIGSASTDDRIPKEDAQAMGEVALLYYDPYYYNAAGSSASTSGDAALDAIEQNFETHGFDLGGLLLELIFSFVNFVADAVTASVGSVMEGHGLSFGWDILVSKDSRWTVPDSVTESEFTEIDTTSFTIGGMQYPNITYSPEKIFAGGVDLLSIDFISGKVAERDANDNLVKDENGDIVYKENSDSGWNGIRATISQWYQVLRLIAIIGLLSVLIYTGIKIILSANAKDKAKYKEWIISWFMAVAILFFMHFIMAFIIAVTGEISTLMTEASKMIYVKPDGGGEKFATNLMGLVRFMVQSDDAYIKVGYEVMYIALIVYTIKFTFVYLKRVLNMAFLTLIAPIVALTYPIDKINDGKAQGFDMWLKEYIFNALLQPMHCILYYVLVGSAVGIAGSNPIYGIAVLAFMTEAEKLLKSIFGFGKANAGTVGGVGSAFAAGAIASSIAKMAKLPKGNAGKGGNGGSGNDDTALISPKPTNKPGMDVFDDEPQGATEERMQEVDDERFGTDEYDPAEREANIRNSTEPTPGSMYDGMTEEEQIEQMRNSGMDDETIALAMAQRNGGQSGTDNSQSDGAAGETGQPNGDSGAPVREIAAQREEQRQQREAEGQQNNENGGFAKGASAVGKKLLKPVWDLDKSKSYNFKRLGKGALKGTAKVLGGFALGATAAAVQAGISITDGKYNPMEGVAAFSAGFAGAGGIVNKVSNGLGSVIDTYREGANAGDSTVQMIRAQKRFEDRDDVIAFNKKNYPGKEKEAMERQRDNYLTAGVTDLKEMKSGMKYADTLVGKTDGLTAEQIKARREKADRQAAATINFKKTLSEQGQVEAIRNAKKQKTYIDTMVAQASDADKARVRRQYENAFKAVAAYDLANT